MMLMVTLVDRTSCGPPSVFFEMTIDDSIFIPFFDASGSFLTSADIFIF